MKKKLVALFLCCALSFGLVTAALITPASAETDFMIYDDKGTPITTVELAENGSARVEALLNESASGTFQWQIMARGVWANVVGATGSTLTLRYAMLANVLNGDGQATIRCRFTPLGAEAMYSNNVTVQMVSGDVATTIPVDDADFNFTVLDPGSVVEHETAAPAQEAPAQETPAQEAPAQEAPAAPADETTPAEDTIVSGDDTTPAEDAIVPAEDQLQPQAEGNTEDPQSFLVQINYMFEDGSLVAQSYTAQLAKGSQFRATVTFPTVQGYLPFVGKDNTTVTQSSYELNFDNVQSDWVIDVYYRPTEVNYTVIHYLQNIDNDDYTEDAKDTLSGVTGTQAVVETKKYDGFYSLSYEQPTIAADGSTVVKVYYDRYYFLMLFDMDGGYGTAPIYVRYGAPLGTINDPQKTGYTFGGWADATGASVTLPATMPAANITYYAIWNAANAQYTIEYYLQNPDDTSRYEYIASETRSATAGTTVSGSAANTIPTGITTIDQYERKYAIYSHADQDVTVAGDGTSIVKVYYDRKEFTLKFYYAMSSGSGTNTRYYVVGGSTYHFGYQEATYGIDRTNEIKLLDQYNTSTDDAYSQRGTVASLPTLKAATAGRYTLGTDSSTVNSTAYTYYYFTFSAKYGAELTNLWPVDVINDVTYTGTNSNGWAYKTAFVSAWNGEYNVYYSQNHSNETIKGKYSVLDYQLLWASGEPADNTVSYLCFWENGAPVSWNNPKLFVYNIWVPTLAGQDTTGLTTTTRNGVTYYLRDTYNTIDDSTYAGQTQPSIIGFTAKEGVGNTITNPDSTKYSEAHKMDFYYARNSYELNFTGETTNNPIQVPYEQPVAAYDRDATYPSGWEKGAYTFEGWYTSPNFTEGTKVDFTKETMPAHAVTLYPHWIPAVHTVEFHLKEGDETVYTPNETVGAMSFRVSHGGNIAENYVNGYLTKEAMLAAAPNRSYKFAVWYYYDENNVKKYFDPTMQIRTDLCLYAEWTLDAMMPYTIRYVLQNDHNTKVADDFTGFGLANTTKTFDAKGGAELYNAFKTGYFPVQQSQSLFLDINGTAETLVVIFEYVPRDEVPYTVNYVTDVDPGNELGTVEIGGVTYYKLEVSKYVGDNTKAVVTETFKVISGYMPDAYQKRLVVSAADGADNVINFIYKRDTEHAYYTITHYTEDLTDAAGTTTWTEYAKSEAVGDIGKEYSADSMDIPGFTYDSTVNGTLTTGKLTENGLELKLYYTRNSYPYEFRFLESGTDKELADIEDGTAKYQSQVTQTAKDIPGYTLVSEPSQTITIAIEDPASKAEKNVKIFYYAEKKIDITYVVVGPEGCGTLDNYKDTVDAISGTPMGSTPTADSKFNFVGWFTDAACKEPANENWIDADNKLTPGKTTQYGDKDGYEEKTYYAKFEYKLVDLQIIKNVSPDKNTDQTFIFTVTGPSGTQKVVIQGTGSVTLTGLKVGDKYTVTEDTSWSWRYTPDHGTQEMTLQPGSNVITFNNSLEKNKWLDGNAYVNNHFTGSAN